MRTWGALFQIDGSVAFENEVHALISDVAGTRVGQILIQAMRHQRGVPRRVNIVPAADPNDVRVEYDAARAHAAGAPLRDAQGRPVPGQGAAGPPLGTGLGSGATLFFHMQPQWTLGADCALVHELTHVVRALHGRTTGRAVQDTRMDNEEEFYAILVENIFASSRGRILIRIAHHPLIEPHQMAGYQRLGSHWFFGGTHVLDLLPSRLGSPRSTLSQEWARRWPRLLDDFLRTERYLAEMLRAVPAQFNPLRDRAALLAARP